MSGSLKTLETPARTRGKTPLEQAQEQFDRAAHRLGLGPATTQSSASHMHAVREGGFDMNPYAILSSGIGDTEAASLSARLTRWHDAIVAHERRLRAGRGAESCDEECPHGEAQTLWAEAQATFGARAVELTFLRSRAAVRPPIQDLPPAADGMKASQTAADSRRAPPRGERRPKVLRDSADRSRSVVAEL